MLVSLPLFMAVSLFSFLFRHISSTSKPHNFHLFCHLARHLSLSASSQPPRSSSSSSISDRLSFVFDQIDQIEKERAEKDEALQRIKAWRESKKIGRGTTVQDSADATGALEGPHKVEEKSLVGFVGNSEQREGHSSLTPDKMKIELVHPWPEWIEFMERLVQQNYFDQRRKDEDTMIEGLGLGDISDVAMVEEHVSDFTRDWKAVQTAVLNFGRDRFDVFRSLSRQDIQLLVGYGCPSSDRKVVFSAKLLRKHVHLDEGDVCSTCSLRSSCEKAYLLTNKEDEARTIDVVRVLLTYGFDPIDGSVSNKSLLKHKSVKTVVRKLLHEVVKLSSVPIDPNLPPPVIKKRPPKVKQPPPPPKRRVGRDDVEMKKGDWLCPKCDFLNFAKNVVCLQCDAKRPKRQLLPGEWECPQCNFLNYRRNMACFHCEHKRPSDDFLENKMPNLHHEPKTRMERAVNRQEVSNAWNFDFDDDESDGADVATFEHADAPKSGEGLQSHPLAERGNFRGPDDDVYPPRDGSLSNRETREYSGRSQRDHSLGFDDFDEEDDDVNDYELENTSRARGEDSSSVPLSDIEGDVYSSSEDEDDSVLCGQHSARMNSRSHKKQANPRPGTSRALDLENDKFAFGSDDDLPAHPKWKSSHVADIRQRGSSGASSSHALRRLSFTNDKDDEFVHGSRSNTGNRQCDFRRGSDFKPRMNRRDAPSHGEHYGGRERGSGGRQDRRRMTGNWNPDLSDVEKPKGVRVNVR